MLVASAQALGAKAPEGGGVKPPAELQAEYPLREPGGGPEPQGAATFENRSGAITVDEGGGPSSVAWLLIALALALALVVLSRTLPLLTRPLRAPAVSTGPSSTGPSPPQPPVRSVRPAPEPKPKRPDPRRPRRPRVVSPRVVRLGGPLFRYSGHDDAVVLRVVGDRVGPVLRPENWVRFTVHDFAFLDRDRSREMGLGDREHGLLLATDDQEGRWTLFTSPELVRAMVTAPPYGQIEGTEVAASEFPERREGWPEEVSRSREP